MIGRIGRYEVHGELGRGGFGEVFRAYDPVLDGFVAIKRLTGGSEPDLVRRFRNEAAAARKLRHPNIVIVYDFGEQDGSPYLVMELLEGEDLEHIIGNRRPLPLLEKLDLIRQVASGLQHAHIHGIVHRDVKPANIMLLRDGTVKIMDFGIALLTQATAARETPKGALIGTFSYMAPEHFRMGASSDALTDIFAYGVVCYKLLTGVHPFQAVEMGELVHNITNKTPVPIRALSPDCPEALEETVSKMLTKDRDLRYQNLEDVHFDLEPIIIDLRRERVNRLLGEAQNRTAGAGLEAALSLVRQALEIEPGNRVARDLRESLHRQIKDREIRPRVEALVNAGRERLQMRQFDAAIQKFESALRLDQSNQELRLLIEQARAAWENAERARSLAEKGRRLLESGNLTGARQSIVEALLADSGNAQAEELQISIEAQIQERERERQLHEGLNRAKDLILLHSFADAIETLRALQVRYPNAPAIGELLDRADAEQQEQARQHRLKTSTEEAKTLLRNGQFEEALERLSHLQGEFPEATELHDLSSFASEKVRAQKQAQALAELTTLARSLIESNEFGDALELLQNGVARFPGAIVLHDLLQTVASAKTQQERTRALHEAMAHARVLVDELRFQEALGTISAFVDAYGNSTILEPLRQQAEKGIEEQRRVASIRKLVADAQTLLDEGRPDSATRILRQATLHFPDDRELKRLLGLARDQAEAKLKIEAISKIIAEAEALARARRFDDALELLDNGLREYTGAERLMRCREATLTLYERERAQRIALERVQELREQGNLEGALVALEAALQKLGDDAPLLDLKKQIEAEHQRATKPKGIAERVQTLIEQVQFESATQMLNPAPVPAEDVVTKLMLQAEAGFPECRRIAEDSITSPEISGIVSRIRGRIKGILDALKLSSKSLPWRWIWSAGVIIAGVASAIVAAPRIKQFIENASRSKPAVTTVVEILTDPPGATVVVGDHTCVTPDCRFVIKRGKYNVEARMSGYRPAQQMLTVNTDSAHARLDLILQPLGLPWLLPAIGGLPAGTLLVRVGLAGALVSINNSPCGRTDALGKFQTSLLPATYQVRVEKIGYQAAEQRVKIGPGISHQAVFTLVPHPTKLEVREIPASVSLPAREHVANDEALEIQAWDRIRGSEDSAQFLAFVDKYPNDVHAAEARSRLDDLTWTHADTHDLKTLQLYLTRFPQGRHTIEALDDINLIKRTQEAEAEKQAVARAVTELAQAIQQKDEASLKALWPSIPASTLERWRTDFRNARSIQYDLHPTMTEIKGDSASVKCNLLVRKIFDSDSPYATETAALVSLHRAQNRWVVLSIR